jgi:DNA replication and repair protein RecF
MALALDRPRRCSDPSVTPPALRLAVRRLTLADFRSYQRLRLEVDERPVVLTGPNGAGKTNLLEALSLLAPGRGLRQARLAEIDRHGAGPWSVGARIDGPGGPVEVGSGRQVDGGRERRSIQIDGAPAAGQAALAELVAMVWLTPAMDRLFQDGASARRRFLDRLVLTGEPSHASQVARYGHALRERNRLLRSGRTDPAWLDALEMRAAAAGVAIAVARRQAIQGLAAAFVTHPGPFPRPELAVDGQVEAWLEGLPALEVEARFAERLAAARTGDAEAGITSCGPHRSDLAVRDADSGRPAAICSTGQQKALLISIVLAEARVRAAAGDRLPILLLDEVAAHLDQGRRADLFAELLALGAQVWLTGTDAPMFAPLGADAQFFTVRESTLDRHDPNQPRPV